MPLLLHLAFVPSYGALQSDDYYGVLERLCDGRQFKSDLDTWLGIRIGRHRVTVPALFWALNVFLFHGSNYSTAALALAFLLGVFLILHRHLPANLRGRSPERWLVAAILSVLVFTPRAGYNLALSFGGIHYYLSDLLALLSIAVLVRSAGFRLGPWPIVILGLIGSFTFSSYLAVWPALVAGAFVLRRRPRDFAVLAVAAGIACTALFWGTRPFSSSGWPGADLLLGYVGVLLGSPFIADPEGARYLGWTAVVLAALLLPLAWVRHPGSRPAVAFWLMVEIYALGNGFLAALGRAIEFGERQAMAARYALFPGFFWAGIVASGALLLRDARGRRVAVRLGLVLALAAAAVVTYAKSFYVMTHFAQRGKRQELTALAVRWSSWEEDLIRGSVSRKPDRVIANLELMQRLAHVPFDRAAEEIPHRRVPRELLRSRPHPEIEGNVTQVTSARRPDLLRVRGWAYHPQHRIEEVVFFDEKRRQTSWIFPGFPGGHLKDRLGQRAAAEAVWEGFVEWRPRRGIWTAYVRLASDPAFYPLARTPPAEWQLLKILAQRRVPARRPRPDGP